MKLMVRVPLDYICNRLCGFSFLMFLNLFLHISCKQGIDVKIVIIPTSILEVQVSFLDMIRIWEENFLV